MSRATELFWPTLKEAPADAEAISHKLMVRAGLIRQVAAGLWTFLPAGWRARETYVARGASEFEEIFELAEPGKDFQLYSRAQFKRVP